MFTPPHLLSKAQHYSQHNNLGLQQIIGEGKDGAVWKTSRPSALKIHNVKESYLTELTAYIRFREMDITEIAGFSIPQLIDQDDNIFALEMTIVTPPFLLDFASAIFDEPPDFLEDEGNTFEDFIRHRFDEHADAVLSLYYQLAAKTGIYLPDMHAQNLKFAESSEQTGDSSA